MSIRARLTTIRRPRKVPTDAGLSETAVSVVWCRPLCHPRRSITCYVPAGVPIPPEGSIVALKKGGPRKSRWVFWE
jgi:hypothetical protein